MQYIPKSPFAKVSPGDDYKNYFSNEEVANVSANRFGLKSFIWNGKSKSPDKVLPNLNLKFDFQYHTQPLDQVEESLPEETQHISTFKSIINPITGLNLEIPIIPTSLPKEDPIEATTLWEKINKFVIQNFR